MTHTPAPWYAAMCDTVRGQEPRIRDTMPAVRREDNAKEVCVLTNYSNEDAQLIAAAPELLDALERCYEVFDMDAVDTILSMQCGMAIKKAKGES